MPRGRYWHVKALVRGVPALSAALFVSFYVLKTRWRYMVMRYFQQDPAILRTYPSEFYLGFDGDPSTWLFHGFPEFLIGRLTYEPFVALIVAGLLCTVAMEIRERERRREP
ncbi:hypothetical protein [Halomicrobium salinisoli]|uniref:hypothetical protein n=1 Tax=Halomicrobium salinisoli TaxID=2878391 RepID=UPI001CF01A9D|nr:hypothetical protein [Halomicrobium salinisoli]